MSNGTWWIGGIFLLALGIAPASAAEKTEANMAGTGWIDFAGYKDCVKLENDTTRVILGPHAGGRVLEYAWKGENALHLDPAQDGWTYDPGKKADIDLYGGRCDIGPEAVIPRHPALWFGPWTAETIGPYAARMTSAEDEATGVRLVREFRLDPEGSRLAFTQTIRNVSSEEKPWYHWGRTCAVGNGLVFVPLTSFSRFPRKYIRYDRGGVNFRPKDPAVRERDGFLEVLSAPERPKLGMDSYAGWFAYLMRNNVLFVKRFPTWPDRMYGDLAAITVCIYYYKDIFCELEPLGPKERILPGESVSFTEEWQLLPFAFPASGEVVDLGAVEALVEQETK
ncbi:MAG: hypothetical protein V1918_01195 [Planctomycetota bacterium]